MLLEPNNYQMTNGQLVKIVTDSFSVDCLLGSDHLSMIRSGKRKQGVL